MARRSRGLRPGRRDVDGAVAGYIEATIQPPMETARWQSQHDLGAARLFIGFVGTANRFQLPAWQRASSRTAERWGRERGARIATCDTWIASPLSVPFWEADAIHPPRHRPAQGAVIADRRIGVPALASSRNRLASTSIRPIAACVGLERRDDRLPRDAEQAAEPSAWTFAVRGRPRAPGSRRRARRGRSASAAPGARRGRRPRARGRARPAGSPRRITVSPSVNVTSSPRASSGSSSAFGSAEKTPGSSTIRSYWPRWKRSGRPRRSGRTRPGRGTASGRRPSRSGRRARRGAPGRRRRAASPGR